MITYNIHPAFRAGLLQSNIKSMIRALCMWATTFFKEKQNKTGLYTPVKCQTSTG